MKKLFDIIDCDYDINIKGIADDSRDVLPGYLFVATKGYYVDHFDYIDDAIDRGAVAIICDRNIEKDIPVVIVNDVNKIYSQCCSRFYDVDVDKFNFIGITGTDGKTTVATFVKRILNDSFKTAYIGTNGVEVDNDNFSTDNTTPCKSELYNCLKQIEDKGCSDVCMEVSSEALLHNRIDNLKFDIIAFTNITEDHLNVHETIENYRNSKFKFLNYLSEDGVAFINGDDYNCKLIDGNNVYSYGFSTDNYCVISNVNKMSKFVSFDLNINGDIFHIISPFLEDFNIYNVTVVFLICKFRGIDTKDIILRIKSLGRVVGRMERLNFGQKYELVLDYAHTLNSIDNVIKHFSNFKRIIVVTGAAGGREKEKRSKIGKLLLENVGLVIFTMDDPRWERVDDIIDDMIGTCSNKNYERIVDRREAICRALDIAKEGDAVLIIGKGRDNYMAIGNKKVLYSDYDVIKNYFLEQYK